MIRVFVINTMLEPCQNQNHVKDKNMSFKLDIACGMSIGVRYVLDTLWCVSELHSVGHWTNVWL